MSENDTFRQTKTTQNGMNPIQKQLWSQNGVIPIQKQLWSQNGVILTQKQLWSQNGMITKQNRFKVRTVWFSYRNSSEAE